MAENTWDGYAKKLEDYDEATTKVWKEGIDSFLVYSTLLSAILTAFIVDVYKSLKPNPAPDPSTEAILRLISILSDGTVPEILTTSSSPGTATPSISLVLVNSLWFAALVISLSSTFVGLLIKQWLDY
ncbi:hypothetical protein OBBRIDRAFT_726623, partial [Obba rivulosa]